MTQKTNRYKSVIVAIFTLVIMMMEAMPAYSVSKCVVVYYHPVAGLCSYKLAQRVSMACYIGEEYPEAAVPAIDRLLDVINTPIFECGACGDDRCGVREMTTIDCEQDCHTACGDKACAYPEADTCEPDSYSECLVCLVDCGSPCGDGLCQFEENISNCPQDCRLKEPCGNGICEAFENLIQCPADCGSCGDGGCYSPYENSDNCPEDCY
jgi:hypothetical protein